METKYVLITGCSTGIGYYCAKALREEKGFHVLATARKERDVKRLKEEGFDAFELDLDSSPSIHKAIGWVKEKTDGKLYALFNNGAYGQPGAVEDLSREVLQAQFDTNFFGTHELTIGVLPMMREQNRGRIIQNSSILGFVAMRYRGAYNASKFALEGLSDTLRLELEGTNIYLSLIEPGPIRSNFRRNGLKKFVQNIDREKGPFKTIYKQKLANLQSTKDTAFTLGEDAVYEVFLHALKAKIPKERYRVTKPTTLFWFLKRILSTRQLDKLLRKVE